MNPYRFSFSHTLHLFVLAGFAVAQPLYDLLARNPEFFVARHSDPVDLLLLVCVVSIGIPASLVGVSWGIGCVIPAARRYVHSLFVVGGVALGTLPGLVKIEAIPATAIFACAILLGVAFAFSYLRLQPVRTFLSILSPAALLFPVLFLAQPAIFKMIRPQSPVAVAEASISKDATVPIVFLIFDEFPVTSLMRADRQIDADLYPNFAALAKNATWFRHTTSVADNTVVAVPAILTGSYPRPHTVATADDHPHNLFTWLAPRYNMDTVYEAVTMLCPVRLCVQNRQLALPRIRALARDLSVVYAHLVLPARFTRHLPDITQTWGHFLDDDKPRRTDGRLKTTFERARDTRSITRKLRYRVELVRAFIQSIGPTPMPKLYFLHVTLPHVPWEYFPDGTTYTKLRGMERMPGLGKETWGQQEDWVAQGHRRHLQQVALVDTLLGELLAHLKAVGMYDETLLVITADHGVSFNPGAHRRGLTVDSRGDILSVPLFIKAPHQQQGEISDRNVETIDILPTIADLLKASLPWPVDGHFARDTSFPDRTENTAIAQSTGERRSYRIGPETQQAALIHKFAHLNPEIGLEGPGPVRPSQWLGKRVLDLPTTTLPGVNATLDHADSYERVEMASGFIPAQITGQIEADGVGGEEPVLIAVAVNGIIRGGSHAFRAVDGEERFSVFLDRDVFHEGRNEVGVYVVSASETGDLRLIRATGESGKTP